MSYAKMMKWQRTHPKGTRQPMIFSTGSGFWPAHAWIESNWTPYVAACDAAGVAPMQCEKFYNATIGCNHFARTPQDYAAMTKAGTL